MSGLKRLFTGELILALVLLIAVLGADFLWVRPQNNDLETLAARKRAAEQDLWAADEKQKLEREILDYVGAADSTNWTDTYRGQNPLTLLEDLRKEAGLRSLDVSLDDRESVPPFERTTYFMSVYGSFARQIQFLKAIESSRPLVVVDALTMDTREADPQVTLKLNVSVLTLSPGATR